MRFVPQISLTPVIVTAVLLAGRGALAADDSTSSWQDATAPRAVPYLDRFIGECPYPANMPYPRKGPPICPANIWISYLHSNGLGELQAPTGGRAYRAIWDSLDSGSGWWQLIVNSDGRGQLTASNGAKRMLDVEDVASFENLFSKSNFATLVSDDDDHGLDACQDGLMEAVINGRYHFVRRGCGLPQDIYVATRIVDNLAGFPLPSDDNCFFLSPRCLIKPPSANHG